jgi:hypothetical protein
MLKHIAVSSNYLKFQTERIILLVASVKRKYKMQDVLYTTSVHVLVRPGSMNIHFGTMQYGNEIAVN